MDQDDNVREITREESRNPIQPPAGLHNSLLATLGLLYDPVADPQGVLDNTSSDPMRHDKERAQALQTLVEKKNGDQIRQIVNCITNQREHPRVRVAALRALSRLGQLSSFPLGVIYHALGDENALVRVEAVQTLTSLGPGAVIDSIIRFLQNRMKLKPPEEDFVQIAIIQLLEKLESRTPVDTLISALNANSWKVREAAAVSLRNLKQLPENGIEQLLARLLLEENFLVRRAIFSALHKHGKPDDLMNRLMQTLRRSDVARQKTATLALGEAGITNNTILNRLIAIATNEGAERSVRQSAILAIGMLGQQHLLEKFRPLTQHKDEFIRVTAEIVGEAVYGIPLNDEMLGEPIAGSGPGRVIPLQRESSRQKRGKGQNEAG